MFGIILEKGIEPPFPMQMLTNTRPSNQDSKPSTGVGGGGVPRPVADDVPDQAPVAQPAGQLSVTTHTAFFLPPAVDLQALDAWLVGVLALDVPTTLPPSGAPLDRDETLAGAWLQRALLLSRRLLQDVRIPVLDVPKILDCSPDPMKAGAWQARLAYARVEDLPFSAYELALKGAMGLMAWAMARPVDDQSRQALFDMVGKGILPKLQPLWRSGKSTLAILRVAHDRSIPFTHLGAGVFQLGWGSKARRIDRSVTGDVSAIGAKLANDKALTASLLRRACLPSPVHAVVSDLRGALNAAHQLGWPVVVKPADRERGEGVSVDVGHDDRLKPAFETAFALSVAKKVIVERQVDGVCHRLFLAHGRLLYAVKRLPMSVVGDGVSDVASLVDQEVTNQMRLPPWERSGIRPLDDLARAAMARAGYASTSVPARGALVALRRIESTEWGGVDEDVTSRVHPENLKAALAASELFGLAVAGIDIISADIGQPWFANGAIINEVNHAPLLGGGDISRSHLPAFLDNLVEGTGMIPVEVFVGGQAAIGPARRRWQELVESGVDAYLSHAHQTVEPSGAVRHMPFNGLYRRTRALVLSPHVEAMVLVVQTDEFLATGLPLEAVSAVTIVDRNIRVTGSSGEPVAASRVEALQRLLTDWRRQDPA